MAHHVLDELVFAEECLVAQPALVWPESCVSLDVHGQGALLAERRRTIVAFKRSLARVCAHVLLKHKLAGEALGADGASKRPLAGVPADVHAHVPLASCRVTTGDALVPLGPEQRVCRQLHEGRRAFWNMPKRASVGKVGFAPLVQTEARHE